MTEIDFVIRAAFMWMVKGALFVLLVSVIVQWIQTKDQSREARHRRYVGDVDWRRGR